MRTPPKVECRECGADLGRSWQKAPLCVKCGQLVIPRTRSQMSELPGETWEDIFRDKQVQSDDA